MRDSTSQTQSDVARCESAATICVSDRRMHTDQSPRDRLQPFVARGDNPALRRVDSAAKAVGLAARLGTGPRHDVGRERISVC
jgi:hypothetical protein